MQCYGVASGQFRQASTSPHTTLWLRPNVAEMGTTSGDCLLDVACPAIVMSAHIRRCLSYVGRHLNVAESAYAIHVTEILMARTRLMREPLSASRCRGRALYMCCLQMRHGHGWKDVPCDCIMIQGIRCIPSQTASLAHASAPLASTMSPRPFV